MKNITKNFIVAFTVATFMVVGCSEKPEKKVCRVGILSGLDYLLPTIDGFKEKMTELGYIEGKNIVYDLRKTNYDPPTEKRILETWVADKVDLIIAFPTEAALLAKTATQGTDIPVLFASAFIEGFDLVEDVRNPGGNITGVRYPGPDIAIKSLETLLEIAPKAKRIWLPYLKGGPTVPSQMKALHEASKIFGIQLVEFPVSSPEEIQAELTRRSELTDIGIDAIMHIAEPIAVSSDAVSIISEFVTKYKLPYHGTSGECVFILTVDPFNVGKQVALLAEKILNGIPAGTIPVISADPALTINYKVARELGITVPNSVLVKADTIIR